MRARATRILEAIWYRGNWLGIFLIPVSWIYRFALALSRQRAQPGEHSQAVPVIVVGNITVGGTGKTPVVMWLARQLQELGHRPGVVTRGYLGSETARPIRVHVDSSPSEVGDEAVLLAQQLSCPVYAGIDRVACVRELCSSESVDVIISDDGLQHFALLPDCSVVVIDGRRGLGNARLLPAGPLREPAERLNRVDLILVNGPDWSHPRALRFGLRSHSVTQLSGGLRRSLADFAGKHVHALAAIGHPERFFAMLREAGCSVDAHAWPDHARIPPQALQFADGAPVLITAKDAVKCGPTVPPGIWSVDVDVEFAPTAAAVIMQTIAEKVFGAAADK